MSENLKLGQIVTSEQGRDAVHMAVVPVEAETVLHPGNHVGVVDGKARQSYKHIGVVDPFLKDIVQEGEKFWLFLYPGSIKSLRHEWLHPAFDKIDTEKEEAIEWLKKFAIQTDFSYDDLISIGYDAITSGGTGAGDDNQADKFNSNKEEFLKHVMTVTGLKLEKKMDDIYFSCSC